MLVLDLGPIFAGIPFYKSNIIWIGHACSIGAELQGTFGGYRVTGVVSTNGTYALRRTRNFLVYVLQCCTHAGEYGTEI